MVLVNKFFLFLQHGRGSVTLRIPYDQPCYTVRNMSNDLTDFRLQEKAFIY